MERIKLRIKKRYINVNGNTITCVLKASFNSKLFNVSENNSIVISGIGRATCNEKDTFDIFKGKQIAYSRAYINVYKKFRIKLGDAAKNALKVYCNLSYNVNDVNRIIESEKKYLNNYINNL